MSFTSLQALIQKVNLWEIGLFCLVNALGLAAVWVFNKWGVKACVDKFSQKNPEMAGPVSRAVAAPVGTIIFLAFFNNAKSVFAHMPGWLWMLCENATKLVYLIATLVFLFRVVDVIVAVLRKKWETPDTTLDEHMLNLVEKGIKTVAFLLVALVGLDHMGVKVLGLLAGLGFIGAAVALALQSTIGNIIGSLEILADRLFRIGDRVAFGEYDGFVTKMGLRSVELTSLYGDKINLPNKDFVDKQLRNFSLGRFVRTSVVVGITYDHTRQRIEQAMAVVKSAVESIASEPDMPEIKNVVVVFKKMGDFSLDLEVVFWAAYKNVQGYNRVLTAANLHIKEGLDQAGIGIAFPTQTLHIAQPESR